MNDFSKIINKIRQKSAEKKSCKNYNVRLEKKFSDLQKFPFFFKNWVYKIFRILTKVGKLFEVNHNFSTGKSVYLVWTGKLQRNWKQSGIPCLQFMYNEVNNLEFFVCNFCIEYTFFNFLIFQEFVYRTDEFIIEKNYTSNDFILRTKM